MNLSLSPACLTILFLLSSTTQAGLFDDLKRQAEKAIQDTTKSVVDSVTPSQQNAEPVNDSSDKSSVVDSTAKQGKYSKYAFFQGSKTAELAAVRFMPEKYQGGKALQDAVMILYPREWASARDEFDRNRKLTELQKRMMADAKSMPLTYRILATGTTSRYDFKTQSYGLLLSIRGPLATDVDIKAIRLRMSPDDAEALRKSCTTGIGGCELYAELIVDLVGAIAPRNNALVKVRQIHIYKRTSEKYAQDALLSDLVYKVNLSEIPENPHYARYFKKDGDEAEGSGENTMEITF